MKTLDRYNKLHPDTQNEILEGIMASMVWMLVTVVFTEWFVFALRVWHWTDVHWFVLVWGLTVLFSAMMIHLTVACFRATVRSIRTARWALSK